MNMTLMHGLGQAASDKAPWRALNLPIAQQHPGIYCGMPVTVIPFGGSITENDRLLGLSSGNNVIGKYLVKDVNLGLLGIDGVPAIGHNTMSPSLAQKDSSMLTRNDMDRLAEEIKLCSAQMIIVAMGMSKIIEVGRYLEKNLPASDREQKLVTLVASHDLFSAHPGDARFNLGFAFGQRFSSERGVRIALHAGLFKPDEICIQNEPREVYFLDNEVELNYSPLSSQILIIGMGGTIEGQELSLAQKFEQGFCEPYIRGVIQPKQLPEFFSIKVSADSREITVEDVKKLKATILHTPKTEIVVTMGTWAAEKVGQALVDDNEFLRQLLAKDKRVGFALACQLPTEQNSDAFYTLGCVLAALQHLSPGVYTGVHGLMSEIGRMTKIPGARAAKPYFAPVQ